MLDKLDAIEQTEFVDTKGKDIHLKHFDITFDNVSFSYSDRPIIQDVSLRIKEKGARNNCNCWCVYRYGKTTLCNLIARFYDVDKGAIYN